MKKYITIAALLAAGTACVNAATAADLNTNLDKWLTELNYGEGSLFELSFKIEGLDGDGRNNLFKVVEDWYVVEQVGRYLGVTKTSDGNPDKWDLRGDEAHTDPYSGTLTVGTTEGWLYDGGEGTPLNDATFTLSQSVLGLTLYIAKNESMFVFAHLEGAPSDVLKSAKFTLSASEATLSVGEGDAVSLLSAPPQVPEPSAFGLLAGIGALALVASRRRRK